MILEGIECIVFLELGMQPGQWTKDHDKWISSFYQSAYDSDGNHTLRPIRDVDAGKIRSFLVKHLGDLYRKSEEVESGLAPESLADQIRAMRISGSGYIHGRAESILAHCCDASTETFSLLGVRDDAAISASRVEYWNVFAYLLVAVGMTLGRWYGPLGYYALRPAMMGLYERGARPVVSSNSYGSANTRPLGSRTSGTGFCV